MLAYLLNSSTIQAKVRILPERVLGEPLEGAEPPSVHRVRLAADQTTAHVQDGSGDVATLLQNWLTQNKPRKVGDMSRLLERRQNFRVVY